MIGTQVEREGIIRHGAKMITAVAEATVPKISVIVRKAYGAGLYAMCGPAFDPDACLALPSASIAVMGAEPAVNAVFYNKIQAIEDPDERAAFVAEKRAEYESRRRSRAPRRGARRRRGDPARGPARRAGAPVRSSRRPVGARTSTAATASRRFRRRRALVHGVRPVPLAVDGEDRRDLPDVRSGGRRGRGRDDAAAHGREGRGGRRAAPADPVAPEAARRRDRGLPRCTACTRGSSGCSAEPVDGAEVRGPRAGLRRLGRLRAVAQLG